MSNQQSEFVGPGKVFATEEEEEFAEYIRNDGMGDPGDKGRA
jgi:hypothetical protein